jgi:hypothetical protein
MASIEYGIDGYGRKIYAEEAYSGRTYICPYCHEEIHVRKCYDKEDYFAHNAIFGRTPQQMMCPGYRGQGRIENDIDRVYITNGGLPLYLYEYMDGKYQLNACFPPISRENMDLLELWDARIEVIEHGRKEEYSANNIRYYRLKTNVEWIQIKCKNLKYSIPEIQQKWGWGIRGLNCEKDIFHSNYSGGYRVALHSNIVSGKEYLIVNRFGTMPNVPGIRYCRKGSFRLNDLYSSQEYDVYSMVVDEVTEDTVSHIQKKGYQLIEKSDEIIPIWPPAVIEGKELIYRETDKTAYLFHNKCSEQQIFSIGSYGLRNIIEIGDVFQASTDNNTILLSDYMFNSLSNEIRFFLTQNRENFDNENVFTPSVTWTDGNGEVNQLSTDAIELLGQKKIYIDADVDFAACMVYGVYVEKSTKRVLENIRRSRKIVISMEPFGMIIIDGNKEGKVEIKSNLVIDSIIKELYRCNSASVPINKDFYDVYEFSKNNSEELLRIIKSWAVKKQMPYAAARYLYQIKEAIKNGY